MNNRLEHELDDALRPRAEAKGPPGPVIEAAARARRAAQARRFGALGALALVPVAGLVLVSLGVPLFSSDEPPKQAVATGPGQAGDQPEHAEPADTTSLATNPETPSAPIVRPRPHPDSLLALSRGEERPPESTVRRPDRIDELSIRAGSLRQLQESGLLGPAEDPADR